jgi:hypothetical protein
MPRVLWALRQGRPCVEIVLTLTADGQPFTRILLADTGAGSRIARFQLILDEDDCVLCGGNPLQPITLSGAYSGSFPTYALAVGLPALAFDRNLRAVGVPSVPIGFDGIACFGFLNWFTYGNFGDSSKFGLAS